MLALNVCCGARKPPLDFLGEAFDRAAHCRRLVDALVGLTRRVAGDHRGERASREWRGGGDIATTLRGGPGTNSLPHFSLLLIHGSFLAHAWMDDHFRSSKA